jgi:dihydrofolate synthase/folylpolyglutamate synthase
MDYAQALELLYSFNNFQTTPGNAPVSKTFNLDRIQKLADAIGNPHRQFQSIHVAGTKGKGSTVAMIESVLRHAGLRTGLYTSPHLHTFRERIRVNGAMISPNAVIAGVEKIQPIIATLPGITTFEIITALAFDYFAQQKIDVAVLEVGLGGRLDATNIVTPRIAVITSISYDHLAILGNTLTQIAREKAGIVKPLVPVICPPQVDEAMQVIEQVTREKNAPLVAITPALEFQVADVEYRLASTQNNLDAQTFTLTINREQSKTYRLKLLGRHQLINTATTLAALFVLRAQGIAISEPAIETGLATVEWQGRFEILAHHPYLVVDGAHNADSAHHLRLALHDYFPNARWHFVFGASNDKDIAGMFAEILPHATSLTLTRYASPRAAEPEQLKKSALPYSVPIDLANDVPGALQVARQRAALDDVICVTGSLFVVAEAREAILRERGQAIDKDAG